MLSQITISSNMENGKFHLSKIIIHLWGKREIPSIQLFTYKWGKVQNSHYQKLNSQSLENPKMAFHISVQKTFSNKLGKTQRALNTIATYGNEGNFTLVNLYRANEPREFLLG